MYSSDFYPYIETAASYSMIDQLYNCSNGLRLMRPAGPHSTEKTLLYGQAFSRLLNQLIKTKIQYVDTAEFNFRQEHQRSLNIRNTRIPWEGGHSLQYDVHAHRLHKRAITQGDQMHHWYNLHRFTRVDIDQGYMRRPRGGS